MSEEKKFDPLKSLDATESVEATIARKVEQIKSEVASSKQNIAEEDVDCFIQELTGCSEVLTMTSKREACSKLTSDLLKDINCLLPKLVQFKRNLKGTREVRSKIIRMETEILKYQAMCANWNKLPFAEQKKFKKTAITKIMEEIEDMQGVTQYKQRLDALFKDCSQILQEIELIEAFNVQFLELQKQYEAILRSVKSSSDISKALLNLKEIKSGAENLREIRDESRTIKDDMINSINQDIEKFTNILENDNLINPLQELSAMWHQIEHDLNTKKFKADSLYKAQTVLNEMRNSIDTSIKVLKEKTGNLHGEEQDNVFQRKFKDIKNQVHAANIEDDGSQFLQFANDLRKLHSQITDHQSLLKEIQNYADTLETEANNLSYLNGIEAKADEIDDLFRNGVNLAAIQVELERFRTMLEQNSFKTSLSRSEKRKLNLKERVKSQVYRLEQLKVKDRQDNIKAENILLDVEKMVKILELQVKTFVATRNENFFELSELLTRYILQLDGIKIPNDEIQTRKVSLLKTLHELGDVLERRSTAAELVEKLATRIKDTLIIIEHTEILTGDEQFRQIKTTFKELQNQRELVMKECYNIDGLKEKISDCDQNLNLLKELMSRLLE